MTMSMIYKGRRYDVILDVSESGADQMLDALSVLMDGGSLELLNGEGTLLVELPLSSPAAAPAENGTLTFHEIGEGVATADGNATTARVTGRDGTEVFLADVGDENSDAVVRLSSTAITVGGTVAITEFQLRMP